MDKNKLEKESRKTALEDGQWVFQGSGSQPCSRDPNEVSEDVSEGR